MLWRIYSSLATLTYIAAGLFVIGRVSWYYWQWDLALWKWIVSIVVAPITFIVMPFYFGFAEGDWSMVAAWIAAVLISFPMIWRTRYDDS